MLNFPARGRTGRVLLSSLLVFAATAAVAQDDELEEIIVTAQNRAQDVQDVPIAMDVIGSEEIEAAGFATMNDMDRIAPAVQINNDQGAIKVTVRGVGTNSNDETQDTSVVVNIDGEYVNRPRVLSAALFDLERVEVLRGPQGTLYGRNSTGGAVNFITRKPGDEFGYNVDVSAGNYGSTVVNAGVDIPFNDSAALRLAAFSNEHDGYFEHPNNGLESGTSDMQGGRVSLRLEPTEELSINLAADYYDREFIPPTFAYVDMNDPAYAPGAGCSGMGYEQVAPNYTETLCIPSGTNFQSIVDREEYASPLFGTGGLEDDSTAFRTRIDWDISDSQTLSYIGGYREHSNSGHLTLPVVYQNFTYVDDTKTQSHELRLNGSTDGGIIYQFGGFYFKETQDREGGFFLQFIGPNGSYLDYFIRDVESDSTSVFGQVEFPMGDSFTLVTGLRYTDNERSAIFRNNSAFGAMGPTALFNAGPARPDDSMLPNPPLNLGSDEDKVTGLIGVNYTPDDDTLWFAKVSTGFKGGGFDSVGPYDPEENTAIEAGLKKNIGAHRLNVGAFHYDYSDLQVSVLLNTSVGGQVFNAGDANIWGVELEGDFAITDRDSFNFSINYLDTEYDELLSQYNAICIDPPDCGLTSVGDLDPSTPQVEQPDFKGNEAPFSPSVVLTAGYEHVFELGGNGELTFNAFSRYKDSYFTDFFNYNDSQQESYTQTDVNLTWTSESGIWSVQAFVRNLEDERPLTYASFIAAGPDDIYNFQFGQPRTYGLRLSVDY